MARHLQVGDYVEWIQFIGKGIKRGNINSIDREAGLMSVWMGTFPNSKGGCKTSITAKKVGRRWLIYRGDGTYRERLRRVPSHR